MVNSQINKEIEKAKLTYGFSLILENYKDFKTWTRNRNNEWNLERGKGKSRETKSFTCDLCGKVFIELDSFRTPAYLRYRHHYWRCDQKEWEKELENFRSQNGDIILTCDDCPNYCPDLMRCSLIQSEQNLKDWNAGLYPEVCAYINRIVKMEV